VPLSKYMRYNNNLWLRDKKK